MTLEMKLHTSKKVVPHDYKRMMSLISSFEQQGLTNEQRQSRSIQCF